MASCNLMKVFYSLRRRRSWRISSPKLCLKLFTVVAVLAYLVILKPTSTLYFLPRRPIEQTPHRNSFFDFLVTSYPFKFKQRSHGVGQRNLLQDRRIRPTPIGYPPPGENQQVVPRAPSFQGFHHGIP